MPAAMSGLALLFEGAGFGVGAGGIGGCVCAGGVTVGLLGAGAVGSGNGQSGGQPGTMSAVGGHGGGQTPV